MNQHNSKVIHTKYDPDGKIISEEVIPKEYLHSREHYRKVQSVVRSDGHKKQPTEQEQHFYNLIIKLLKERTAKPFIKFPICQVPIFFNKTDYYIIDIYFEDLKIAIEVDGLHHGRGNYAKYDRLRDKRLSDLNIHTVRVWNHQVKYAPYKTLTKVINQIETIIGESE